jgi:DNA-binding protein HU-beta
MAKKLAAKKKTAKKMSAKKPAAKKMSAKPPPPPVAKIRAAIRPRNANTNSYTFSELIENVRGFCGLNKRAQAKEIVADLAAFITDSLRKGYKVPLLGLGKIYVRQTKARTGRNPATGEAIQIPARKRVRFTAAKSLKEAVLS